MQIDIIPFNESLTEFGFKPSEINAINLRIHTHIIPQLEAIQVEAKVSDDLGRKFIEKAYLYRCNYIRDIDNWEGGYSYLIADSLEEAYELAKILYDKENECIIDIRYIECKKKDDIYGCYMLAPNSR